eukprot:SAG11_NODE_5688_length_1486_cov_4.128335_1_plen_74_part_00
MTVSGAALRFPAARPYHSDGLDSRTEPHAYAYAQAFDDWWKAVSGWRERTRAELRLPSKWYDDQQLAWAATPP